MALDDADRRCGHRRHRTTLIQGLVRSALIVVRDILHQDAPEVALAQDEEMIENLLTRRSDPAFRHDVSVRCPKRSLDDLDALAREDGVEARRELGILIADEEPDGWGAIVDLPTQVTGLLGHPCGGWVRRAAGQMDPACPQFDEEEHVDRAQEERLDREEVASEDLRAILPPEGVPGTAAAHPLRCRRHTLPVE